jgi:hypothetical protein
MKAYMSDRTLLTTDLAIDDCMRASIAQEAIDEAKRILADVEYWGVHESLKPRLWKKDEDKALVESLETFIKTLDKMGH